MPAGDNLTNRDNQFRNLAYPALKLARVRSTRTVTKCRTSCPPVPVGRQGLVFGNMFSTESGQSPYLEPCWGGLFIVLSCDDIAQNYTVKIDARMYSGREAVFHSSVVKPYKHNDDEGFPGLVSVQPVPILINEEHQ